MGGDVADFHQPDKEKYWSFVRSSCPILFPSIASHSLDDPCHALGDRQGIVSFQKNFRTVETTHIVASCVPSLFPVGFSDECETKKFHNVVSETYLSRMHV